MNFKSIYEMWSWTVAIRFNSDDKKSLLSDKETPFTVVPNSKRFWCADPFLFKKDSKYYLFFEAFDIFKRKGLLGYRELLRDGFGDIKIVYEHDTHLSFPFIYEDEGEIYIIPESAKSKQLIRLKCTRFPDDWAFDKVLLNEAVVDTVRYKRDGTEYFISEKVDDRHIYDRVDLYYSDGSSINESDSNPVKVDITNARGAGVISTIDDICIRPSQDCGDSYGKQLNLNRIITLNKNTFSEEKIDTISFEDVKLNSDLKTDGIHTYNKLDNIEVIDLRIPGKFNLLYTVGFVNKVYDKLKRRK